MRNKVAGLVVIASQLLLVGFFCRVDLNNDVVVEKHVSTIHNENLNKIANSVSILFEEEEIPEELLEVKPEDTKLEELPSIDVVKEEKPEPKVEKEEIITTPLVSVDASKYSNKEEAGFKVTEGNQNYTLEGNEFDVVVAVVAGEFDETLDDALGVVSVILNRCDNSNWRRWAGENPYSQVIRKGQFEVYFEGYYLKYMPGGSQYGKSKYNIAKQAVIDGLNGIRNNEYLGFRAWHVSSYSDNYIVYGGNRYGFN